MSTTRTSLTIAAVGDLHCRKDSQGTLQPFFAQIADKCDVLVLCGDLTDYGLAEEAQILAKELSPVAKVPIVAVMGNHDHESATPEDVVKILSGVGVTFLEGNATEIHGVGFAGVKGFCGGFGRRMLEPWGEGVIKAYVREAVDEALKLESALARLRTPQRIAVMHYSPIEATVEGEPREIFPFLGTSRLEDPLNRHDVTVAFHGHVHRGALEGRTRAGVPVYNVAMPLLRRSFPDQPPFRVITIPVVPDADERQAVQAAPPAAQAAPQAAQAAPQAAQAAPQAPPAAAEKAALQVGENNKYSNPA